MGYDEGRLRGCDLGSVRRSSHRRHLMGPKPTYLTIERNDELYRLQLLIDHGRSFPVMKR
jgi:hypothetical protein